MTKKTFKLNQLPKEFADWMKKSDVFDCGSKYGNLIFNVKKFFFSKLIKADCKIHDLCYMRGGNLFDKIHCDWVFAILALLDGINLVRKTFLSEGLDGFINMILNVIIVLILLALWFIAVLSYFTAVTIFGVFAFSWGKMKTLKEIRKKYDKRNIK